MSTAITLPNGRSMPCLPNNDQWQYRFEVRSESSGRVYIVSQNIKRKHWGCSCPGYRRHRNCKHLRACGLPTHEKPYLIVA